MAPSTDPSPPVDSSAKPPIHPTSDSPLPVDSSANSTPESQTTDPPPPGNSSVNTTPVLEPSEVDDMTKAPLDYATYEKWQARFEAFPEEYDCDDWFTYESRIPLAQLAKWKHTFNYRHPGLAKAAHLRPFLDYYDRLVYPLGDINL